MSQSNIGVVGLGVMGSNLARNLESHGFMVSVFNYELKYTQEFMEKFGNGHFVAAETYAQLVKSLERPRKLLLMVTAGAPVDAVLSELTPLLEAGDIVIDGGNSFYKDTQRRYLELQKKGIEFVGSGISGGSEGALKGASLMPGCTKAVWKILQSYLQAIAAKDFSGQPCVARIGENGAGHYVKMVHNGIEYAVMQLMAETYAFLSCQYHLSANQIADVFTKLGQGKLHSYLFDIVVPVLRRGDDLTGKGNLIDVILDRSGSKGTGQWASVDALERGVSIASITAAVFARYVSSFQAERLALAPLYKNRLTSQSRKPILNKKFIMMLENALYAAMISCYAQGYDLIQKTAAAEHWQIDLAEVSRIWEGGCIIRAKLLKVLHEAYQDSGQKDIQLLAIPRIVALMKKNVPALRQYLGAVIAAGVSAHSMASALFYFQDSTAAHLPANLIQGLRDYFGAHTYERVDRPGSFHTDW